MSAGRLRALLAKARPKDSGGANALISRTYIAPTTFGDVRTMAPQKVGDDTHFVSVVYNGNASWRLGFAADSTGDGLIFAAVGADRFTLYKGRISDGSGAWQSATNQTLYVFWAPPAAGAVLEARINDDGSVGLYADGAVVITSPAGAGHSVAIKGDYVSFAQAGGSLPTGIKYGGSSSPMLIDTFRYDPFARNLDIDVIYTNIDVNGTRPTLPQVDYGDGTLRTMTVIANAVSGRATLRHSPSKSIAGYKACTVRWGNAAGSAKPFSADIVLPFGGQLGGNGVNVDNIANLFFGYAQISTNTGAKIAGLYEYASSGQVRGTIDGVGGVRRTSDGQIGGNDQGFTYYIFRQELSVISSEYGVYTLQWPPGWDVVPQDYPVMAALGWAYDRPSGVGTITLSATSGRLIWLRVNVASIPAGTTGQPGIARRNGIPSGQTGSPAYIAFQNALSDGPRPLDYNYNNRNANNRTRTQMAVSTLATEKPALLEAEIKEVLDMGAKFCYGMNSHIDDAALVAYKAQQYATRLPKDVDVYVQTTNEAPWNFIFQHANDLKVEGCRQGFHAVSDASQSRTPITIVDGATNFAPQFLKNLGGSFQAYEAIAAGTNFFASLDGGWYVFTANKNIAINDVVNYNNARLGVVEADPILSLFADNGATFLAGSRYLSHLQKRNIGIWRDAFTAADRPAPIPVMDSNGSDPNNADQKMNWGNLRQYMAEGRGGRLVIAPYFNNGLGGFDCMNYSNANVWDATAKAMITNGDYAGAAAYITPKAIGQLYLLANHLESYKANLYAKNVQAGLAADAVRLGFYEFGDHSSFAGYPNWPTQTVGANFYFTWVTTPAYADFLKAYYRVIGSAGAEAFTYTTARGPRPFRIGTSYEDTSSTNIAYKATKEFMTELRGILSA